MSSSLLIRGLLIAAGTLLVGLAFLGVFLPLLPTTPFLLLSAVCYAKSSKKFYDWLLNNRLFGEYIRNYREGKGIPLKSKVLSILLIICTIGYTSLFVMSLLWVRIILLLIAVAVIRYLLSLPTLKKNISRRNKHVN